MLCLVAARLFCEVLCGDIILHILQVLPVDSFSAPANCVTHDLLTRNFLGLLQHA